MSDDSLLGPGQRWVPWPLPKFPEPRKVQTSEPRTWGPLCSRGLDYAVTGAPVASGTPGQVRKISTGRKARAMASEGLERLERSGLPENSKGS